MTLSDLDALLTLLRRHGATVYQSGETRIELSARAPQLEPTAMVPSPGPVNPMRSAADIHLAVVEEMSRVEKGYFDLEE